MIFVIVLFIVIQFVLIYKFLPFLRAFPRGTMVWNIMLMFMLGPLILAGIYSFCFFVLIPKDAELYCNKSTNSCIVTKYYRTGQQKTTRVADYNSVVGVKIREEECLFLITPNKEVLIPGAAKQNNVDYLNREFARQAEEIRLKYSDR